MSSVKVKKVNGKSVMREEAGSLVMELKEFEGDTPKKLTFRPKKQKSG